MGRDVLDRVIQNLLKTPLALLFLLSIVSWGQSAQRSLHLVSSHELPIEALNRTDARKVFLGVPVVMSEVRLIPFLNESDPLATRIFLQQVIFMSDREYRRQLVSRTFRLGGQRPREIGDIESLAHELLDTPGSVTFMWSDDFNDYPDLKSLGIVWTGLDN